MKFLMIVVSFINILSTTANAQSECDLFIAQNPGEEIVNIFEEYGYRLTLQSEYSSRSVHLINHTTQTGNKVSVEIQIRPLRINDGYLNNYLDTYEILKSSQRFYPNSGYPQYTTPGTIERKENAYLKAIRSSLEQLPCGR